MIPNKYLLDTNIFTYLQEQSSPFHRSVTSKLARLGNNESVYFSVISLYEVEYGASCCTTKKAEMIFKKLKKSMMENFPVMPLDEKGAKFFGVLKTSYLRHTGITKESAKRHDLDFMIGKFGYGGGRHSCKQ